MKTNKTQQEQKQGVTLAFHLEQKRNRRSSFLVLYTYGREKESKGSNGKNAVKNMIRKDL